MLVHICCSVDSHYFLNRLKAEFPHETLIGYFYNPNIHPKEEYDLRLLDVQKSCATLGIKLIEGEYDDSTWFTAVRGLEESPEKGERCTVCFDYRFTKAASMAKQLGETRFTSTLLQSPLKDKHQLHASLKKISDDSGVSFVFVDYVSHGGREAQNEYALREGLYRQNYCGCLFGLAAQRERSSQPMFEGMSELSPRTLPADALWRQNFYAANGPSEVFRARVLGYRCLLAKLSVNQKTIPSYILAFSTSSKEHFSSDVLTKSHEMLFLRKEGVRLVLLSLFNKVAETTYATVCELLRSPPPYETEIAIRQRLTMNLYDVSPIFIVDSFAQETRYTIDLRYALVPVNAETPIR